MRKRFIIGLICLSATATAQEAQRLHTLGKNYLVDGDYANAEAMLVSALAADTANPAIIKDLSLCYYFEKEFQKGLTLILPVMGTTTCDDQCYQLAGNLYKGSGQSGEAERVFREGIARFPQSGPLYSELGELKAQGKSPESIALWERGIENDPAYPRNYYHACRYYAGTPELLRGLLYAEIYINMDPQGTRTSEIKELLLSGYRDYFRQRASYEPVADKIRFLARVSKSLDRQSTSVKEINTQTLTIIRTRFIIDWYQDRSDRYLAYRLFEFHRELLRKGLFEAYNQWVFGPADQLQKFQSWTQLHGTEYAALLKWIRNKPFTMPPGQHYYR